MDSGEKIDTVIVNAQQSGHAEGERILIGIELGPHGRHLVQEVRPVKALLPSDMRIRRVLPAHAKDVTQ